MLVEVAHETRFGYSGSATLGPHTVRLQPRSDAAQRLRSWELVVDPEPAGRFELTDAAGNAVTRVWWSAPVRSLTLRMRATVETLRRNPFDFLVFDPALRAVPPSYPPAERAALAACLDVAAVASGRAARLARDVASDTGEVVPFLTGLAAELRRVVAHEHRPDGDPLPSDETLARGRGACRDAAVAFVDACRSAGIAARFVSGYQVEAGGEEAVAGPDDDADGADDRFELHAWAEAYVPGAGWRGFDPSLGLAVAERHVALAAAAHPRDAGPTEGTFGPAGVRAALEASLRITAG